MPLQSFPTCPGTLKTIQHYLKTALEHDGRDIVVSYWCRLYAMQQGLKIDRSSPEAKKLLFFLMDWLEKVKSEQRENEAITHDIPAQAHLENYALKLFLWADSKDRAADFDKNVWKAFYTSGNLFDVLQTFGELTEELQQNRKYAKWKAAYIHNCLKNGETPVPGPMGGDEELDNDFSNNPTSSDLSNIGFQAPVVPDLPEAPKPSSSAVNPQVPVVPNIQDNDSGRGKASSGSDYADDKISQAFTSAGTQLSAGQITKAQKYCKFASSALTYDDVSTAVNYLQKALSLLTTGVDE